ncbi:MAG: hypothetical protein ACRCX2_37935 [Paraclostridium sp.]
MRTKNVEVAGKRILITEKTIGEIKKLSQEINVDFDSFLKTDLEGKNTTDVFGTVFELLENKITTIFPQLTNEDIDNAYVSEIESLIDGFIEVNFSMLKKVFIKVTSMM